MKLVNALFFFFFLTRNNGEDKVIYKIKYYIIVGLPALFLGTTFITSLMYPQLGELLE